jgi:hypothetical protein
VEPEPDRRPSWALILFQVVATAQAVLVVMQPVLAGRFLSGDYPSLRAHQLNGLVLTGFAAVQLLVALLAWGVSRVPPVLAVLSGVLFILDGLQVSLGFTRALAVHVPLGVLILGGAVGVASRAWRTRAGARRAAPAMVGAGS